MTDNDMARRQQDLAADGRAEGQCPWCGSYRLDGKPPVLHSPLCEGEDDWKADPLAVLDRSRAAQQESAATEDCPRCRHWTPAQRKWHHCIGCDGTGQVPAQREESTR